MSNTKAPTTSSASNAGGNDQNPEHRRAVKYLIDELNTHFECKTLTNESKRMIAEDLLDLLKGIEAGQANTDLSKHVDRILSSVDMLSDASRDLLSGAEAQINELAAKLEGDNKTSVSNLSETIDRINKELQRRSAWSEAIGNLQEELENECLEKSKRLEIVNKTLEIECPQNEKRQYEREKKQLGFDVTNYTEVITCIVEHSSKNNEETQQLAAHRKAVEMVIKGLPTNIIGRHLADPAGFQAKIKTPRS